MRIFTKSEPTYPSAASYTPLLVKNSKCACFAHLQLSLDTVFASSCAFIVLTLSLALALACVQLFTEQSPLSNLCPSPDTLESVCLLRGKSPCWLDGLVVR